MNRISMIYLLLALTLCLTCTLGATTFHTRGEAREAVIVQSMYSTGNYLLPSGYNNSVPSKPPLFHWLATYISNIFGGLSTLSIRMPSVIFALLAICLFVMGSKSLLSSQEQTLFLLFLAFSFEWLRASVSARVDMVHASSLACGLLCLYHAYKSEKTRYWLFSVIFITLATLAKGPVGIAIPALVLTAWLLLEYSKQNFISKFFKLSFVLSSSLLCASIWYYLAYLKSPNEFYERVWYENFSRFTDTMADKPHNHSVFYLIGMFFLGTLPWSFIFLLKIQKFPKSPKQCRIFWQNSELLQKFSILTIIIVLAFYSIPGSKRSVYLLVCYPFLALLAAKAIPNLFKISNKLILQTFHFGLAVVFSIQLFIAPKYLDTKWNEKYLAQEAEKLIPINSNIYSFGYEFYAASYYMNKRFLRLEDRINTVDSLSNRYFITLTKKNPAFLSIIQDKNLTSKILKEIDLGDETVIVGQLYSNLKDK